jgi:FkbM family methyltransferase
MTSTDLVQEFTQVSVIRRLLRWYAGRYDEGSVVRIPSGYAAGMKWRRFHRYVNGYWTGRYELELQRALVRELKPGHTFYDLGANAGFFSLLASRIVGKSGRVFAFEPLAENVDSIRIQIQLNEVTNCEIVTKAVSDRCGKCGFAYAENNSQSKLSPDGIDHYNGEPAVLSVETTTLNAFAEAHPAPRVIKMDVEGAEVEVLEGASQLLRSKTPPVFIIELHGSENARRVQEILLAHSYRITDLAGNVLQDACGETHIIARQQTEY